MNYALNGKRKKCVQDFGSDTSCKLTTLKMEMNVGR
jgi:hypothetical protein